MPFNLNDAHQAALNNSPGFFTPYKDFSEYSRHAIGTVIVIPILAALATAAAAAVAALAIIPALGSLGVAGGAALLGAKETSNSTFTLAANSAWIACAAAAASIVLALFTVLIAITAPIAILTNLGATAYAAVVKTPVQHHAAAPNAEDNLFAEERGLLVVAGR
ncbi:MAG: hypothetical protein P4L65_06175 [Legionella sp.]|nr:hypothetical protein [Legionella sp.]